MSTRRTYRQYLRLDELLSQQHPVSPSRSRHELLFIIQHQVAELWMKLLISELEHNMERLRAGDLARCLDGMGRTQEILQQLIAQWSVLETLPPDDFAEFRSLLRPASGLESEQYREIEFLLGDRDLRFLRQRTMPESTRQRLRVLAASPSVFQEFVRLLSRRGHPVPRCCLDNLRHSSQCARLIDVFRDIHARRRDFAEEYRMCQTLVDLEEKFQLWRFRHLSTVRRIIGFAPGTGATTGVDYLASRLDRTLFPELYAARTTIATPSELPRRRDIVGE